MPARHRLRDRAAFAGAARGSKAGGPLLVVHARRGQLADTRPARVGFAVSRAVGNAVQRNRTKRQLRAIVAAQLGAIPPGTDVLVRATPAAAAATHERLAGEVDRLLARALGGSHRVKGLS